VNLAAILARADLKRYHSEAEVAQLLGYSVGTMQQLRRAGAIRFKRNGPTKAARICYSTEHLREFLERGRDSAKAREIILDASPAGGAVD
jgi:hypothetical protein